MGDKKTPSEECARCRLLETAWHGIARHPAIVPPNWEPGNGQSYAEAVLERLDSRGDEDALRVARGQGWDEAARKAMDGGWIDSGDYADLRAWNPYRPAQELPMEMGAVIVPADGHDCIEAADSGVVWRTREAVLGPDGRWRGVWRADSGPVVISSVSQARITPGTWKVDNQ